MMKAKYTELFSEYLIDHTVPEIFDDIDGFKELFILHFADKEIGFETETLFGMKLEERAEIYIPEYAQRIQALATAKTKAANPIKIHYGTDTIIGSDTLTSTANTTIIAGEQNGQTTDLPFNATTAEPNTLTHTDSYTNTDSRATNDTRATSDTTTHNSEESGLTVQEAYFVIDELNKEILPLIKKLLNEFDSLFMQVY